MDIRQEPQTRQEFIRNKHREIYRKYLELLKKEKSENSLRAEHILCPDHRTGHDSADGSEIHSENNKQLFAGK